MKSRFYRCAYRESKKVSTPQQNDWSAPLRSLCAFLFLAATLVGCDEESTLPALDCDEVGDGQTLFIGAKSNPYSREGITSLHIDSELYANRLGLFSFSSLEEYEEYDYNDMISEVEGGELAGVGSSGRELFVSFSVEPDASELSFVLSGYLWARDTPWVQDTPAEFTICPVERRFDIDVDDLPQ